ncbi:hypothetical protein [Leisingera sp. JC1]|uniref:hypothetical protein n=1 Tax=Leisingera sp. JC1 TaxID=1855282 RepID=UPI0015865049|nr:hypothetical protein [Leisingera sp. JC1]
MTRAPSKRQQGASDLHKITNAALSLARLLGDAAAKDVHATGSCQEEADPNARESKNCE